VGKQKDRYKAWGDASMKAWQEDDVEAQMELWADGCTYTAAHPFGEHSESQGLEAFRRSFEGMTANWSDKKLIENQLLSANKERGIFHTWQSWVSKDGSEWACTFINIVSLDENDRCTKYKEWNVAKTREDEAKDSN